MTHLKYETRLEDLTSRIPSLFAYLEFNEDWTTTLHSATDSYNGSWGKIVENIALPCGIFLCTYVETETEPKPYDWNSSNTFPIDEVIEDNYTVNSSEFIRKVRDYEYIETKYDSSIDYQELPELPEIITSEMPENVKIAQRDKEGNLIYDCDQNLIFSYYKKETNYIFYVKKCLLEEGGTYSYRTLIDYFYQYRDVLPQDNQFIVFMNEAIGKVDIDKKALKLDNENKYPKVPEFVYLAKVQSLLEKYKKIQRICVAYQTYYLNIGKTDERLQKKCDEYEEIGGDVFTTYLEKLLKKAKAVADKFYCYAENRNRDVELHYNLPIFQSKNDLGYLSCYLNPFTFAKNYRHGELVAYNGRTYICLLNRFINGGNNFAYVLCNGELYKASPVGYSKMNVCNLKTTVVPSTMENNCSFICLNNEYYEWNITDAEYKKIDVTDSCSGIWDEELEINVFDEQHFVLLSDYIGSPAQDISIPSKEIFAENDEWYSEDNIYGNHYKIYINYPSIPQTFVYENLKVGNSFYTWDKTNETYVIDTSGAKQYIIEGQSDSKLKTLRSYQSFTNEFDEYEEPVPTEDWLYYYRIGNYTAPDTIRRDSMGNITRFGNTPLNTSNIGQYVTDLMAYGTILTNISCDTTNKTLTFEYVVDAHLKAKLAGIDSNSNPDGVLYYYDSFEYDENDTHGIVHTETYHYIDIAIDNLVANGDFQNYVEGKTENITNFYDKYGYKRFAFLLSDFSTTITLKGNEYAYLFTPSNYKAVINNDLDFIYQPLYKTDYFVGYSYEPNIDSEVDIKRGNGAAYERHIRLSEIHTLEDLENTPFFEFAEA